MDRDTPLGSPFEQADPRQDSGETFRWSSAGSGVTIVEFLGGARHTSDLRIPAQIQGRPVTRIGFNAFRSMNLTGVTIPDTVTFIGAGAFSNNRLSSIDIPDSVRFIEDSAFENNLLERVRIPPGVTVIENRVFSHNQLQSVYIPEGVTSIGHEAFLNNQLESIRLPAGVCFIGNRAFESNLLSGVVIPQGITFIGNSVFALNQLSSVSIPDSVVSIESGAFEDNQLADVHIPPSVISIGDRAFAWNWLAGMVLPPTVAFVGENAFVQYDNEREFRWKMSSDGKSVIITGQVGNRVRLRIPPEIQGMPVSKIEDQAFTGNHLHRRTSVIIPDSVVSIGRDAFAHNHLSNLVIPSGVNSIGPGAFANNRILTLTLGRGIKTIAGSHPQHGSGAFANNRLTTVEIPEGVTYIGDWAFSGNPLSSISLPPSVTYIGVAFPYAAVVSDVFVFENGFFARLIDNDSAVKILRCTGMEAEVCIPSSIRGLPVTVIGDGAFEFNVVRRSLGIRMESVSIPSTVVFIEREAFAGQALSGVTLPDSIAYIGSMAFSGNHTVNITIGGGVMFLRWPPLDDTSGGFGPAFAAFYESQGRKAGAYTFQDGRWKAKFR